VASGIKNQSGLLEDKRVASGLRRVELWVWDRDSPEFQALLREETEITRGHALSSDEREAADWSEAAFDDLMAEIEQEEAAARTKPS
jgi:hypothetical protein